MTTATVSPEKLVVGVDFIFKHPQQNVFNRSINIEQHNGDGQDSRAHPGHPVYAAAKRSGGQRALSAAMRGLSKTAAAAERRSDAGDSCHREVRGREGRKDEGGVGYKGEKGKAWQKAGRMGLCKR